MSKITRVQLAEEASAKWEEETDGDDRFSSYCHGEDEFFTMIKMDAKYGSKPSWTEEDDDE